MYRRDRVNERDVPESQHTIFIRGLPGSLTTEEIRPNYVEAFAQIHADYYQLPRESIPQLSGACDHFDKDGGCTFDFVKVSPDRSKLYIAVRFENKQTAKDIYDRCSNDGEVLGHPVEVSWFRDIRRYLAHCAKQGIPPSRFNQGGGGGRRDYLRERDGGYRGGGGGGGGRRGRSRSISPLRTRTRSGDSQSRSRTRSPRSGSPSAQRGGGAGAGGVRAARSASRTPSRRSASRSPPSRGGQRYSRSRSKSASSGRSSVVARSERNKSVEYNSDVEKREPPARQQQQQLNSSPSPPPASSSRKSNKSRKKERKERKRRRHQHSSPSQSPVRSGGGGGGRNESDMDASDGEIRSPVAPLGRSPLKQQPPIPPGMATITSSKPIGPTKPAEAFAQAVQQQQRQERQQEQQQQQYTFRHVPAGSVAQAVKLSASSMEAEGGKQLPDSSSMVHQQAVQNNSRASSATAGSNNSGNKFRQTFTVDLDPNASSVPKFKPLANSANADTNSNSVPMPNSTASAAAVNYAMNGAAAGSFVHQVKEELHAKRPRLEDSPPPAASSAAMRGMSPPTREGPLAGGVFRDVQRQILQDVRYKPSQAEREEESLGGLRLSQLSKQRMTEEMREEKVAKLSQEMRERVNKRKRQLELSYRHDCETFGLVTRKLIEKDRTLEDRLKLALLETMKDLEGETLKQLDEFLDQLSYIY